jgi:hypothetical protein
VLGHPLGGDEHVGMHVAAVANRCHRKTSLWKLPL